MEDATLGNGLAVLVDDAVYTEAPRWHDGALWFSDIGAGLVRRILPDGTSEIMVRDVPNPSGLGWTQTGDLLVTGLHNATIYRIGKDGSAKVFCGPEAHGTFGTNDMATAGSRSYVTCSGRVYQEGDDFAALAQPTGKILLIEHDTGACRIVADGMRMPNGIAISADGKTLVVNELFAMSVLKFAIARDGSLSEKQIFATYDTIIDGLCLDAEGGVWVGGTGTQRFQRFDADGNRAGHVAVPEWGAIAPMLGGPDGRTLFMAVSQMDSPDAIFEGRAKARIVSTRVPFTAAAEAVFPNP